MELSETTTADDRVLLLVNRDAGYDMHAVKEDHVDQFLHEHYSDGESR